MSQPLKNTIVLGILCVLIGGVGSYLIFWKYPAEVQHLKKEEKVLRMRKAKLSDLFAEEGKRKSRAQAIQTKWETRYKTIPDTLRSSDVVQYVSERTQRGFKNTHVTYQEPLTIQGFEAHRFRVEGTGYFMFLYQLIWQMEQERRFFRVENLRMEYNNYIEKNPDPGTQSQHVMVDFSFTLDAFSSGLEAMDSGTALAKVPQRVFPPRRPNVNPFYPIIFKTLPPNTGGLVNIETAKLISIVGHDAVFKDNDSVQRLSVGDSVYLGRIVSVDPKKGRVIARLNKGGITDRVVVDVNQARKQRQAQGDIQLSPIH